MDTFVAGEVHQEAKGEKEEKKKKDKISRKKGPKKKERANNTCHSRVVTHHSTTQARPCLTSVIGREPVLSR